MEVLESPEAAMAVSCASYYAARAAEYEAVYAKPERQADLRLLEAWLPGIFAGRRVLEVAAGTGWWTLHGARDAALWLATDLNPETLAVARAKPALPRSVRFATADAYTLAELGPAGDRRFDAAFAGFWWSHVPRARLAGWLDALFAHLAPGAPVVFIDNRYVEGSSTPIAELDAEGNSWQHRRLADGSRHRVLKNHPTRAEVESALGARVSRCAWFGDEAHPRHYWAVCAHAA
jgi:demethylmenaquinone methyltransferase/2-methoxy-6-polyprenyl-1,4-benzoquinol methylase